jgi:hypothetical protein
MMVRRKIAHRQVRRTQNPRLQQKRDGTPASFGTSVVPASQDFLSITCQHIGETKG